MKSIIGKLVCWLKGEHEWRRRRRGEMPGTKVCVRCGVAKEVKTRAGAKIRAVA